MSKKKSEYSLIDSGNGRKLERFGPYLLDRPCSQAAWAPQCNAKQWAQADARFVREQDKKWVSKKDLPEEWQIEMENICLQLSSTEFGHLGVFPEHAIMWKWIREKVRGRKAARVLNLFAYSGGATLAAAQAGANVCHVDSSQGMVSWAKENAALNKLEEAPIRWIVDDAGKFIKRECRRGNRYDAIILDPPSFGRGRQGEVFKIERDLPELLARCRELLSDQPFFILFSCHTPGYSPHVLRNLIEQMMECCGGSIEVGEMLLPVENGILPVPSGTYCRWCDDADR